MYRETRDAERANQAGAVDLVNDHECQLDKLYHQNKLGNGRTAEIRYEEGIWLRQLYINTHNLSEGVVDYEGLDHDQSEPTEAQAWNLKVYMDTSRALGKHWAPLFQVCCLDGRYGAHAIVLDALDALAQHRGTG